MKPNAMWGLVAFAILKLATSFELTINTTPTPSSVSRADEFIYFETPKITITCSVPAWVTEDVDLRMDAKWDSHLGDHEKVKFTQYWNKQNTRGILEFNENSFDHDVTITCSPEDHSTFNWVESKSIEIRQEHKTMNVKINFYWWQRRTVHFGDKIEVYCFCDGVPGPTEYHWYNRTADGDVKLKGETERGLIFTLTKSMYQSIIICGCKSKYDDDFVKSNDATVASLLIPYPYLSPQPWETYFETSQVTMLCFINQFKLEDNVTLTIYHEERSPGNPVFPEEQVKLNYCSLTGQNRLEVEIQYNKEKFVPFIQVYCEATNQTTNARKRSIINIIEQQYRTMNVIIEGSEIQTAYPGDEVNLTCVADGNPLPRHYQWINKTEFADLDIIGVNEPILQLKMSEDWYNVSQYICGAKNKYNKEFVYSNPVQVSIVKGSVVNNVSQYIPGTKNKLNKEFVHSRPVQVSSVKGSAVFLRPSWLLLVVMTLIGVAKITRNC